MVTFYCSAETFVINFIVTTGTSVVTPQIKKFVLLNQYYFKNNLLELVWNLQTLPIHSKTQKQNKNIKSMDVIPFKANPS